ncbi:MAG: hypothetical protein AB7J32_10855, partial [Pseudonocardia sp.]
ATTMATTTALPSRCPGMETMRESTPEKQRSAIGRTLSGRTGAVVAAVAAVACAALTPLALPSGEGPGPAAGSSPAPTPSEPIPGMLEFHSPVGGFALNYPSSWTRAVSADPQVPIVAHHGPYSFLVRVVELPAPPADPNVARQLADKVALSDQSVKLLAEPRLITLAGLPGYYYLYTFTDRDSGSTGAHSHFFVFKGSTMLTLVFQAMPADSFRAGAETFDEITHSFRVE